MRNSFMTENKDSVSGRSGTTHDLATILIGSCMGDLAKPLQEPY